MAASLSSAQPANPRKQKLNRARPNPLVNNLMMSLTLLENGSGEEEIGKHAQDTITRFCDLSGAPHGRVVRLAVRAIVIDPRARSRYRGHAEPPLADPLLAQPRPGRPPNRAGSKRSSDTDGRGSDASIGKSIQTSRPSPVPSTLDRDLINPADARAAVLGCPRPADGRLARHLIGVDSRVALVAGGSGPPRLRQPAWTLHALPADPDRWVTPARLAGSALPETIVQGR